MTVRPLRSKGIILVAFTKYREKFYNNIDLKKFTDNKTFGKMWILYFQKKNKSQNKITLVENDKIITDDT